MEPNEKRRQAAALHKSRHHNISRDSIKQGTQRAQRRGNRWGGHRGGGFWGLGLQRHARLGLGGRSLKNWRPLDWSLLLRRPMLCCLSKKAWFLTCCRAA